MPAPSWRSPWFRAVARRDMTITRLRAMKPITAIGIAFAAQEITEVPKTPRDARLDLVLTEREIIDLRD